MMLSVSVKLLIHGFAGFIGSIRKRIGGLKLDELPGLESLQIPGIVLILYLLRNSLCVKIPFSKAV